MPHKAPAPEPTLPVVRVGTWNILNDPAQREQRLAVAAAQGADLDVLCVQEAVQFDDGRPSTAEQLADLAGYGIASTVTSGLSRAGERFATAVLTRLPVLGSHAIPAPACPPRRGMKAEPAGYAAATLLMPSGRHLLAASLHLPWGAGNEPRRVEHAHHANAHVEALLAGLPADTVAVLAGDLNAEPDSDTLRFLTGKSSHQGEGTYWVDAWDKSGQGHGYTSYPASGNENIIRTALRVGIADPSMLPDRRIDYILVRGWAHGRPGTPIGAWLFGGRDPGTGIHASDHYAVAADLWDPPTAAEDAP